MFLKFYGLDEQPFGVTPDPRFLYMGPAQQEAFSSLIYGIEAGRGFMALIASPGLGKTTILLQLMERLRESARTAFLFQTYTNSEEFLRSLLTDLEIEPSAQDLGEMQRQLGDALMQEARSGKRIVVAVDEAQNLDDQILEMVRMLSNFETPQSKLLQIVLVGQPQLADKLASPHLEQLRQRISIITHFPPLNGTDVPKYIDHRLRTAGYRGGQLFTHAALRVIVAHTKGIPRNINNLCFQALSLGYAKNEKIIDEAILREVIADLSLETLGTSPPDAQEKEPSKYSGSAGDSGAGIKVGIIPPSRPVTVGSGPIPRDRTSLLDAVSLSSGPTIADVKTTPGARRTVGGRVPAGHGRKHPVRPLLWFGLAALLGYLWVGPRLKSGFDSLERVAGGGGMSPKSGEVTTTSAPAAAGVNSPGALADPKENQTTLSKEALRPGSSPENPASKASEATSPATGGENPVAPTGDLISSETRGRPTTHVDEVPPTRDGGLPAGSGQLVVESSISGARITINGESNPKWITPHLFWLASGTYVVSVSRGAYMTWTKRVRLDEGREKWIVAEMTDQQQEEGIFTVDTDPSGMQVFIDGKAFGPSRVETMLRPGWHVCAVIPGPGLKPLFKRFLMQPGGAITRRIRMEKPVTPAAYEPQRLGSSAASLTTGPQGGTP